MRNRRNQWAWFAIALLAASSAVAAEPAPRATCPTSAPADAFAIGQLYDSGIGVRQDFAVAAACYLAAAKAGDRTAQFNIGAMYDNGRGVPRDVATAAHWYRLAAEQGHGRAAYALGLIAQEAGDRRGALAWFRAAERVGIAAAKQKIAALTSPPKAIAQEPGIEDYRRGLAALTGQGEPPDSVAAFRWFSRSARDGSDLAAYALADLYERGEGAPRDDQKANLWFNVAAREFEEGGRLRVAAEEGAARTATRLTPQQRAEAKAEAHHFLATLERPAPAPSAGSTRH